MSKKDIYSKNREEEIPRYLSGDMSDIQKNIFEKEMERDPFLADAVEGMSDLTPSELKSDLEDLSARLNKRQHKKAPVYYRIAAAVVVLLGISSILLVKQLKGPALVSDNILTTPAAPKNIEQEKAVVIVEDLTEKEVIPENKNIREENEPTQSKNTSRALSVDKEEAGKEQAKSVLIDELTINENLALVPEVDSNAGIVLKETLDVRLVLEERLAGIQGEEAKAKSESVTASEPDLMFRGVSSAAKKSRIYKDEEKRNNIVSGRILDADNNEPIPGVSILKKGATEGVTTDMDGYYSIKADSGDILFASFIGMESRELMVENKDLGDILLKPDLMSLDEVMVIGYGTANKEESSGTYSKPMPLAGIKIFRAYVKDNQIFPETWIESNKEVVRIRFKVNLNGQTGNFEIVRSPDTLFSEEAIRLIKEGPEWTPAKKNNVYIEEEISLRIVFKR